MKKKNLKIMTIEERRKYLINRESMPLSFDPTKAFKRKNNKKYTTVLIGSGEHSFFARVKKGSRVLIGSGEHSFFAKVGTSKKKKKQKLLSKFRKI